MDITTALAGLKVIAETAKIIGDTKKRAEVLAVTADLTQTIISSQQESLALLEEKRVLASEKDELKQKIVQLEDWSSDAARYELQEVAVGFLAYAPKPSNQPSGATHEPRHWLCAQCYQLKQKSILQRRAQGPDGTLYFCPNCKNEFLDSSNSLVSSVRGGSPSLDKYRDPLG